MDAQTHPNGATAVHSIEFSDDNQSVTATKLVSMGELVLLERGDDQLRLDAMLLEGLSWQQDATELAEFVRDSEAVLGDPASSYDNRAVEASELFRISNEYTTVTLGTVDAGLTKALQIKSEKGISTLGIGTLGALTTIESTLHLSRWFQTPIGPEQPL